jgi:hypothetical protein
MNNKRKRRVYENNEFFPFFAPMRSFIKDLSNLHTDFFSSALSLSLSLSLFFERSEDSNSIEKEGRKNLNKEQGTSARCV